MTLELKADWLDNLHIATPCRANWQRMEVVDGDERVRFCGTCEKNVYNVSLMSRDEAKALVVAHEGSLCIRLARRKDGTLITNDCPVGQSVQRSRRFWGAGFAALLIAFVPSPVSNALAQASGWALRTVPGMEGVADSVENVKPVRSLVVWWQNRNVTKPPVEHNYMTGLSAPIEISRRESNPPMPPQPIFNAPSTPSAPIQTPPPGARGS